MFEQHAANKRTADDATQKNEKGEYQATKN
jgi:hypothetical protein